MVLIVFVAVDLFVQLFDPPRENEPELDITAETFLADKRRARNSDWDLRCGVE